MNEKMIYRNVRFIRHSVFYVGFLLSYAIGHPNDYMMVFWILFGFTAVSLIIGEIEVTWFGPKE